jgi:hypothetical protein
MAPPTGDRIHRKAINTPGHAHELTFSCYHRFQFLKAERTCQWLAEAIQTARVKDSFDLWAFVFMPGKQRCREPLFLGRPRGWMIEREETEHFLLRKGLLRAKKTRMSLFN